MWRQVFLQRFHRLKLQLNLGQSCKKESMFVLVTWGLHHFGFNSGCQDLRFYLLNVRNDVLERKWSGNLFTDLCFGVSVEIVNPICVIGFGVGCKVYNIQRIRPLVAKHFLWHKVVKIKTKLSLKWDFKITAGFVLENIDCLIPSSSPGNSNLNKTQNYY